MNPLFGLFNSAFQLNQKYYQYRANSLAKHSRIPISRDLPIKKCISLIENQSMYQHYLNLILPENKKNVQSFANFHRKFLLHRSNQVFNKYINSEPKITEEDLIYSSRKCFKHNYDKTKIMSDDLNTNSICYDRLNTLITILSFQKKLSPESKDKILGNVFISTRYNGKTDYTSRIKYLFYKLDVKPEEFNPIKHLLTFSDFNQIDDYQKRIIPMMNIMPKITDDNVSIDSMEPMDKNKLLSKFLESENIKCEDIPLLMEKMKITEFDGTDLLEKSIKKNDYHRTIYLLNYSKINFDKLSKFSSSPQIITKIVEKMEQTLGYETTKSILVQKHAMYDVTLSLLRECGEKKESPCYDKWNPLLKYLSKFRLNTLNMDGYDPYIVYHNCKAMDINDLSLDIYYHPECF